MPRIVDHARRKAELLEASLALVAAEGIEAASMRRLAAAAECTTGAITYYFDGREALLVAMLRHAHTRAAERMTRAARRHRDPRLSLWAILLEALPLDDIRLAEWRVWLGFWGVAAGESALRREHAARYAEWRGLLQHASSAAIADAAKVRLFVDTLQALIDGYGVQMALCGQEDRHRAQSLRRGLFRALRQQFAFAGLSPPS